MKGFDVICLHTVQSWKNKEIMLRDLNNYIKEGGKLKRNKIIQLNKFKFFFFTLQEACLLVEVNLIRKIWFCSKYILTVIKSNTATR